MAGKGLADVMEWKGQWCWTRKYLSRPWNEYAYFRKTVELNASVRRAIVRVSADARYALFVNGKRAHEGPARSYPRLQCYDELDLADLLGPGRNALAVIAHQYGVPTFQSVYRNMSGFLLDGQIELEGESIELDTPEGWLCRPAGGWRKDVVRQSIALGFQEHFDADVDPAGWMEPQYVPQEAEGWAAPVVHGPAGIHPWTTLQRRISPLLTDRLKNFTAAGSQFSGENARGYKITPDVYHFPCLETRKKERGLLEDPQAMLKDDDDLTTIPPPPDGEFVCIMLDPGKYRTGHFVLDIAEAEGDEIIDILYGEELDAKTGFLTLHGQWSKPAGCEEATADRYRCRPGAQRWETFHYKGMRHVGLIFRNVEKPLKIRHLAVRQVHAAVEMTGKFECSDERLNQIWHAARRTQLNCLLDAFVDNPRRGQAQWWNAARVAARVTAYAFGDSQLLERGIRQMAQSQAEDGSLHSHPPADVPNHRYLDVMMAWVGTLWEDYFHTGRTELLADCLPALHRLFDFFARHEGTDGLLDGMGLWPLFIDNRPLYRQSYSAPLNMLYLKSLRWGAAICQIVQDAANAARYDAKAVALARTLEQYFWDPAARVWRDGFDPATQMRIDAVSQQTNTLAILLELNPESRLALAKEVLLKGGKTRRGRIIDASPGFYTFVLEAIGKAGLGGEMIEIIGERWGEMLEKGTGTFWQEWDGTGSRCCAASASPLYHLSQQVLGVVPVEVGWKRIRIAPRPGKLEFARGVVPSPLGPIHVEWEKVEEDQLAVRVDLPPGMEGEFVDPLGESRELAAGNHEFHT